MGQALPIATYVLIHGAGSDSWYWHLVVPELEARGHHVVAPDLPCDDDSAGLDEYASAVVEAIRDRTGLPGPSGVAGPRGPNAVADLRGPNAVADLIVVAQSLGGFTAPLVCDRVAVDLMVLVAAMVPSPGESGGEWWGNVGWEQAHREQARRDGRTLDGDLDVMAEFFHDVPPDVVDRAMARGERRQSGTPFEKPWPLSTWPDVPTRFLLCRHDRFFPPDLLRRVAKERLGITPDEMDGGTPPRSGPSRRARRTAGGTLEDCSRALSSSKCWKGWLDPRWPVLAQICSLLGCLAVSCSKFHRHS